MLDFLLSKIPSGLGVLCTVLVGTGILGFLMRTFRKNEWLLKVPYQAQIFKFIKKNHKYLAGAALIIGPVHGFLALGGFRLHTGTLVMMSILLMFIVFVLGHFKILKNWLVWHRRLALVFIMAWSVHYVLPWLI